MKNRWYKDMVFYQIWPRSFMDGNGDGIGDLYGVYEKLDYIKSLGADGIWFSPLYSSPNADYGYDIADYMNISQDYGDMDAFKRVLDGAHARGMKVIMDLVINHTSDEHEWFIKSRDKSSKYHDYYFWRDAKPNGKLPNNWDSLFEGKAWEYDKQAQQYYLHIFTKKQPDLNMDNPEVREEVKNVMRFWLDMGIDGFREDVITFISKKDGLPDDVRPFARGMKYYSNGPRIHEYLAEFKRDVFDKYDCMTLGEAPMMNPKTALTYIDEQNDPELDLMFNFQHMEADCLFTEYMPRPFSLRKLKRAFSRWQYAMQGRSHHTLYLENHDHPRVISRYGSEKYHDESGKSLACAYLFQLGTPFIYQGQEIGMTNIALDSIDKYIDVTAKTQYARKINRKGVDADKALAIVQRACRDNARTPMQWSAEPGAGFTTGKPWFYINPNYEKINVAAQENDPYSLLNFYRAAIALRKRTPAALVGKYAEYNSMSKSLYVYERVAENSKMLVICSLVDKPTRFKAPAGYNITEKAPALCSYKDAPASGNTLTLRPYEARVYVYE